MSEADRECFSFDYYLENAEMQSKRIIEEYEKNNNGAEPSEKTYLAITINNLINYIRNQQKELELKDKVIDEMKKYILERGDISNICENFSSDECSNRKEDCRICLNDYFINKVKEIKDE